VQPFGERTPFALTQLKTLSIRPMIPLKNDAGTKRLTNLCDDLFKEHLSAGVGYHHAMRGLLALIAIEVIRLAGIEPQPKTRGCASNNATVRALERLIEENFHRERHVAFYAEKLAMTPDRLNDHIKRSAGITAGRLIRQRVLTEAKRQLVFTNEPIHRIANSLAFSDLSHFIRFFRQNTGTTPHMFREERDV
jgi:AraC family transcriptional regulator, transcriptional activator of pobA